MTSEELESTTSSGFMRETRSSLGSSARSTGEEESMNEMRQDSRHASTTERQQRRKTVSFRNEETRTKRRRAVSQRPIFRAQGIDPKADRAIVADAVDFVVSASSKGCVSLVSKIAELLKYKISLEQKVISLSKELQTYKSQTRSSVPITLKLEASQLTKPSLNETKVEKFDTNCELLLPGVVPYPDTTSTNGNSLTHPPTITVSQFQDKGFGKDNGICSLPQISPTNESFRVRKSYSDSETQTVSESNRKPEMIDRGCSPIPQVDLENKFEERINLVISEKQFQKRVKTCQEMQTECDIISRKDKLIERGHSPDLALETVTPLQLQPKKSQNKNKVYPSISNKMHKCETLKGAGDLGYLPATKSRPSSPLSVTNHSSKSFPGVKNKHDKCPCSTCKMQRNGPPRLKKK